MLTEIKVRHRQLNPVDSIQREEVRRRYDKESMKWYRRNVKITTKLRSQRFLGCLDFTAKTDGCEALYDIIAIHSGPDCVKCAVIDIKDGEVLMRSIIAAGVYRTTIDGPFSAVHIGRAHSESYNY